MKYTELQGKAATELQGMGDELQEKLRDLRRRRSLGQLSQVRDIRLARKELARVLTALRATDTR